MYPIAIILVDASHLAITRALQFALDNPKLANLDNEQQRIVLECIKAFDRTVHKGKNGGKK